MVRRQREDAATAGGRTGEGEFLEAGGAGETGAGAPPLARDVCVWLTGGRGSRALTALRGSARERLRGGRDGDRGRGGGGHGNERGRGQGSRGKARVKGARAGP